MSHYQKLETEKYLQQEIKQRLKAYRKVKNRRAVRDFLTFLFGIVVIVVAWQSLPTIVKWFLDI